MSRGLGSTNAFQPQSPLPLPFPHPRIQPRVASRHHGTAIMPLGLRLPQMPRRCYNPEQVSVCQTNGKTYGTGTIMQTKKITEQLCPKKSGSACWRHDPGYRFSTQLLAFLMTPPPAGQGLLALLILRSSTVFSHTSTIK